MSLEEKLLTAASKLPGSELIKYYDQNTDARRKVVDWTSAGWCHGMCIAWLRAKKTNGFASDQFWTDVQTSDFGSRMRFLMADQSIRATRGGEDSATRVSRHLRSCGLTSISQSDPALLLPENLGDAIFTSQAPYVYILFPYFSPGIQNHVVAAVKEGDVVRYFDPNVGELQMALSSEALTRWMRWLWGTRYKGALWGGKARVHTFR